MKGKSEEEILRYIGTIPQIRKRELAKEMRAMVHSKFLHFFERRIKRIIEKKREVEAISLCPIRNKSAWRKQRDRVKTVINFIKQSNISIKSSYQEILQIDTNLEKIEQLYMNINSQNYLDKLRKVLKILEEISAAFTDLEKRDYKPKGESQ